MAEKQNLLNARTSIALTKEVIDKLKPIAKSGNCKLYEIIKTMVDILAEDADFRELVIFKTQARHIESKKLKTSLFRELSKLPLEMQGKLKSLTADQLEDLLSKVGK